jgi:HD-GYP domain-containing protein (c-di-GMP phosphodiesterase class II)
LQNSINIKSLLDFKTRVWIYLLSFCSIIFLQTFCTNVCPFIDGLQHDKLFRNLFIIFILQLVYREFLYTYFKESRKNLSLPRQAYFLSIISWILAGFSAFILHNILYPDFPLSSHFRIFSSYLTLGAGILAQLEYIIFEKRYKELSKDKVFTIFNEKISQRIIETFLIFTITPIITILLIIGRYNHDNIIDSQVTLEVFYIGLLMIISAVILAISFGKILKEDTKIIIGNIKNIENGEYENTSIINRPDELGEISYAMKNMSSSIKDGIHQIESLSDEIINTQKEIIYTMGEIAETRSKETGNHVKRVAEYSKLIALKLGINEQEAEMLKLASPMHDIGKVGIPDNILNKPGKLTPEEFEIMKTHAQLGYEMLKHSSKPILQAAAIVSKEHHEKYNGKGYPRGLKGEDIHIFARITAVADVFDALGSDRIYKKAWEDEKIFELFNSEKGEHFDPKVIEAFFHSLDEIKTIRERFKDI